MTMERSGIGSTSQPSCWPIGAQCTYTYKGPHGFAWKPERHTAVVLGHTKRMIRIEAFDGHDYYRATVRPESLVANAKHEGQA